MYGMTDYGWDTLAAADRIQRELDKATERDDERMVSARGGPHVYRDGRLSIGWCDICGVAFGVHQ